MYRIITMLLLVLAVGHGTARGGNKVDSNHVVYEQRVTCYTPGFWNVYSACWDAYRVDSVPLNRQGIVIYMSDEHSPHKGECVRVTLYVANKEGVDTLYNCCGNDGLRIIDTVTIGSFVCYRHPADDTHWISPAAITVVGSNLWCISPDCIRRSNPAADPD